MELYFTCIFERNAIIKFQYEKRNTVECRSMNLPHLAKLEVGVSDDYKKPILVSREGFAFSTLSTKIARQVDCLYQQHILTDEGGNTPSTTSCLRNP
ncbi:TPA: hypothetical protein ACTZ3A_001447 [Bacillus cereus]